MRLLKRILLRFKHLTFIRNNPVNKHIDQWFIKQLKEPEFEWDNDYTKRQFENGYYPMTIKLNDVKIWVSNKYYGGPHLYQNNSTPYYPYMDTSSDFYKAFEKWLASQCDPLTEVLSKLGKQ